MKIYREIQQGTEEWHTKKLGVISGTVLDSILGTPKARESTLYEIVGERLTPKIDMEYLHENAMNRGVRLEPEAISAFEYVTGKKVERVGFCEHDDHPAICYSPDGLVLDTDYSEDVEIKCPEAKNYIKIVLTNEVPKEYKAQIIQGFVVNKNLKIRWFVAYNPDIPSYPIHIIPVYRETLAEEIANAYMSEIAFLNDVEEKLKAINK